MNKFGLQALLVAGVLIGCSNAPKPDVSVSPQTKETKDTLVTSAERYSYALGMNLGRSLRDVQEVGLDIASFNQGMESQFSPGQKVLLTDEEAEAAIQSLVVELEARREALSKSNLEKALAEQIAFLEKNKTEEGVITTASGLQYKVIRDSSGVTPKRTDKVKVHYVGTLLSGNVFDSSYDRGEPLEFPVNAVIEGWQELLTNIKTGMKVRAWIPSALAYGEEGAMPIIPGNSLLIFDVELLEVEAFSAPADTLLNKVPTEGSENSEGVKADSSNGENKEDKGVDANEAAAETSAAKEAPAASAQKKEEPKEEKAIAAPEEKPAPEKKEEVKSAEAPQPVEKAGEEKKEEVKPAEEKAPATSAK